MVRELHLDLAEFAVVIAVGRLVSDQILAAQLARDSLSLPKTSFRILG